MSKIVIVAFYMGCHAIRVRDINEHEEIILLKFCFYAHKTKARQNGMLKNYIQIIDDYKIKLSKRGFLKNQPDTRLHELNYLS